MIPIAVTFTVVVIMSWLGAHIIERYRSFKLHAYGEIGSLYIEGFLAPNVRNQTAEDDPGIAIASGLARMPRNSTTVADFGALRIWSMDGELVFSSIEGDEPGTHDAPDLEAARAGRVGVELTTVGSPDHDAPLPPPFIEIYSPIHDPVSGDTIAIGEVYQNASEMLRDQARFEASVWGSILLATAGLLISLGFSVWQSMLLRANLGRQRQISDENLRLRREAEEAQIASAVVNEQVLNLVGAELHDGPVQMLALMALMEGEASHGEASGMGRRAIAADVLAQLRGISDGLILPELSGLSPRGVVDLVSARHHALTGMPVEIQVADLPDSLDEPRKVCLYRIVQEGLTNALHHGNGEPARVTLRVADGEIAMQIRNLVGPSLPTEQRETRNRLGLLGMQRRLHPFGGRVEFRREGEHAVLDARLPI